MAELHCDRRGILGISNRTPNGHLRLNTGTSRSKLRGAVEALGRLARDNKTWLVPGIPEADTDEEAVSAASVFADRVHDHLARARLAKREGR